MLECANLDEFHKHILACFPQEACGILVDNIFHPIENVSSNPVDNFEFSEKDSLAVAQLGNYKVLHSHTMVASKDDPRIPSYEDMLGRVNTAVPWGIVHCDGSSVSDILWFGELQDTELLGRDYLSNVTDCFTLARDFYWQNFRVDVGLHPRPANWEEWNPHYIEQTYQKAGFTDVRGELRYGDILLYSIGSTRVNHIGIYVGDGNFLHHLYRHKSSTDTVAKWHRQFVKAIRYNNG